MSHRERERERENLASSLQDEKWVTTHMPPRNFCGAKDKLIKEQRKSQQMYMEE